jgi:hypothetical protein
MDKIKKHIRKRKRMQALREKLVEIMVAFVIALALTYIFIFLAFGIV